MREQKRKEITSLCQRICQLIRNTKYYYRQISSANDDRASECSSTASSKPPMYPLTPTSHMRNGYTGIGMKQRELRTKLHKTRYAQSLRQTNSSPTSFDSPSSRRTPQSSPNSNMVNNFKEIQQHPI